MAPKKWFRAPSILNGFHQSRGSADACIAAPSALLQQAKCECELTQVTCRGGGGFVWGLVEKHGQLPKRKHTTQTHPHLQDCCGRKMRLVKRIYTVAPQDLSQNPRPRLLSTASIVALRGHRCIRACFPEPCVRGSIGKQRHHAEYKHAVPYDGGPCPPFRSRTAQHEEAY